MKATGIVRRIDDLGRVVIPKEIRRTLRIREGDRSQVLPVGDLIPKLICGFGIINHRHSSITHNQLKYHAGRSAFEAELTDCHRRIAQRRSLQHAFLYLPLQF